MKKCLKIREIFTEVRIHLDICRTVVFSLSNHIKPACLDFLKSKFGTRVISRKTEHIWPPYSPDLSPMDFSFWSYVLSHVIRCQPATIQELKMIVSDFISNMEPDYLRKIARQTRRRAEFCVSQNGGHFEHLLKKKCN